MTTDGLGLTSLIGIYHADGGPVGEAKYIIGKLLGLAHCALCDITHSPVRRKPVWDRMVARLGIPFTLLHLNELPEDVAQGARRWGTPAVLGRCADGTLTVVVGPAELERQNGSVALFESTLLAALRRSPRPCAA